MKFHVNGLLVHQLSPLKTMILCDDYDDYDDYDPLGHPWPACYFSYCEKNLSLLFLTLG